jgi:hypothetical protein
VVQPITHHETVGKIKTLIFEGDLDQAPVRFIKQNAYFQAGRLASAQVA